MLMFYDDEGKLNFSRHTPSTATDTQALPLLCTGRIHTCAACRRPLVHAFASPSSKFLLPPPPILIFDDALALRGQHSQQQLWLPLSQLG